MGLLNIWMMILFSVMMKKMTFCILVLLQLLTLEQSQIIFSQLQTNPYTSLIDDGTLNVEGCEDNHGDDNLGVVGDGGGLGSECRGGVGDGDVDDADSELTCLHKSCYNG